MAETTLEELVVRIKVDAQQLERALAELPLKAHTSTAKLVGAFALGQIAANKLQQAISHIDPFELAVKAVDAASKITNMAKATDFAVASLVNLDKVLKQSGTNVDDMAAAVSTMKDALSQAASGQNKQLLKDFNELGLSITKLKEIGPERAFYAITQALYGMKDAERQTEIGRDILGRGFKDLLPAIKDARGELGKTVDELNKINGPAVTAAIKKLDELGNSLGALASDKFRDFSVILAYIVTQLEKLSSLHINWETLLPPSVQASLKGYDLLKGAAYRSETRHARSDALNASADAAFAAADAAATGKKVNPAAGNNRNISTLSPQDLKMVSDYITKLKQESEVLGQVKDKQAGLAAYYDILNRAKEKGIKITEEEKNKIIELADANAKLKEEQRKQQAFMDEIRSQMSSALADIALGFNGASFSAENFSKALAKIVIQKKLTEPLVSGLLDLLDTSSIGKSLGGLFKGMFADGGNIGPGEWGVAGENGPERVFGGTMGKTVFSNKNQGGGGVTIVQNINVSPGIQGTVEAEIRRSAPSIMNGAVAAVAADIQNGGAIARLVGKR